MWRNAQGTKKYSAGSNHTLEELAEDCAEGNVITVYADYDSSTTKYSLVVYLRKKGQAETSQTLYYSGDVSSYTLPTAAEIGSDYYEPTAFIDIFTDETYTLGSTIELRKDTALKAYYGDLYRITYCL